MPKHKTETCGQETSLMALFGEKERLNNIFNEVTDPLLVDAVVYEMASVDRRISQALSELRGHISDAA
ncbi:MAG: hypothetical protein ACPLRM_02915 [Anaerolineae bacterium]